MERDAVIAHGMAKFLKERLMDCSDAYSTYVCGICEVKTKLPLSDTLI